MYVLIKVTYSLGEEEAVWKMLRVSLNEATICDELYLEIETDSGFPASLSLISIEYVDPQTNLVCDLATDEHVRDFTAKFSSVPASQLPLLIGKFGPNPSRLANNSMSATVPSGVLPAPPLNEASRSTIVVASDSANNLPSDSGISPFVFYVRFFFPIVIKNSDVDSRIDMHPPLSGFFFKGLTDSNVNGGNNFLAMLRASVLRGILYMCIILFHFSCLALF